MPWFTTLLCSHSPPVHGTGLDSIRSAKQHLFTVVSLIVIFQCESLESLYEIQVGFTSMTDYLTYTWVKDDEVAFSEEVIQVVACAPVSKSTRTPPQVL